MRILLIVHGYPPAAVGGTEVYTHDLATTLATDPAASVFVLTREADPNRPDGDVRRETEGRVTVDRVNNTFRSCTSFEDTYRNPTVLRAAASVVSEIRPDIAHVHHLTCLSTDLVEFLSGQGVPVVLTLHDYWMLCHRGQLFDLDERRCDGPIDGECCRCVPASAGLGGGAYRSAQLLRTLPGASAAIHAASRMVDRLVPAGDIDVMKARFSHMRDVLSSADVVLAPSQTIADRFAACGMAHRDVRRWDLGIRFTPVKRTVRDSISPLRVGFVGSFIPTKAPHLLIEAARMLPAGSVTVDLAGEIASYHGDDSYRTRLAPLLSDPVVQSSWFRSPRSDARTSQPPGRSRPAVRLAGELAARDQGGIRRGAARRDFRPWWNGERRCAARSTAFCSSPGTLDALAVSASSAPDGDLGCSSGCGAGIAAADDDRAGRRGAAKPLLGI